MIYFYLFNNILIMETKTLTKRQITMKKYREKHKEAIRLKGKKYYEDNKEQFRAEARIRSKKYHLENPEKKKESDKKYRLSGKKIIIDWKRVGLIVDDYELIFDRWEKSTHCEMCKRKYTIKYKKCMEHNHITGEFRSIACSPCNARMLDKKKPINNTSGHKNVMFRKDRNKWIYLKKHNGLMIKRSFKTFTEVLCFKYIILLKFKTGLIG